MKFLAIVDLTGKIAPGERIQLRSTLAPERTFKLSIVVRSWSTRTAPVRPKATSEQILQAEKDLGFSLPPLLVRICLEIGNGGCQLGPGIYGIGNFADSTDCQDAVTITREMANEFVWWKDYMVIADQGCSMYSCIDCCDAEFRVFRLDGNGYPEEPVGEPTPHFWYPEADTLEDWFEQGLNNLEKRATIATSRFTQPSNSQKP